MTKASVAAGVPRRAERAQRARTGTAPRAAACLPARTRLEAARLLFLVVRGHRGARQPRRAAQRTNLHAHLRPVRRRRRHQRDRARAPHAPGQAHAARAAHGGRGCSAARGGTGRDPPAARGGCVTDGRDRLRGGDARLRRAAARLLLPRQRGLPPLPRPRPREAVGAAQ